jgi:hypothetical protein
MVNEFTAVIEKDEDAPPIAQKFQVQTVKGKRSRNVGKIWLNPSN